MNLVVDVGNTLVKMAVFDGTNLQYKKISIKKEFLAQLATIFENYPGIDRAIVASVSQLTEHQAAKLRQFCAVLELTSATPVPFVNEYATPLTLGVDRIALVAAAAKTYPGQNALVIDAGTCVTYDFLTEDARYKGGAISPGLQMRYKAMHSFTAQLPLLDAAVAEKTVGNSTATAIHSGAYNGLVYEIDGFIEAYKKQYSNLTVILTGGDAHFLRDRLKNDIFANSNFLLEGLNFILEHNKHTC
ncbi:MAG: pantothenate kinase [Flavobacteriaceae bacterium]|nr:pantothenate kinase [Flavobacteriaceae bacterium]